jgi:hypothetical protein
LFIGKKMEIVKTIAKSEERRAKSEERRAKSEERRAKSEERFHKNSNLVKQWNKCKKIIQ